MIGRCIIPDFLFEKMRLAPILWIDEKFEKRVENIFFDYIENSDIGRSQDVLRMQNVYKGFRDSLGDIKKKLGLEKYNEIYSDLLHSEKESLSLGEHQSNRVWIGKLLKSYYDPLYLNSLKRRNPLTLVKGSVDEIKAFINSGI